MSLVVCVGLAVSDLVLEVETIPTLPGKHFASGYRTVGGGPAATAAATVARLGGQSRFVGCLGDDAAGRRILDWLRREDVDVEHVQCSRTASSPISAVLVDADGERLVVNYREDALHTGTSLDPAAIDGASALLVDLRWPLGATTALRVAQRTGIPRVVDFDTAPMVDVDPDVFLGMATHVVFARSALADLVGTEEPEEGLRRVADRSDAWLAVTSGADGVRWLEDGKLRRLAAFEVDAIDTLGAGDVFHGAFTWRLAEGDEPAAALHVASAAAALRCRRGSRGANAGIPTADEVETLLLEKGL